MTPVYAILICLGVGAANVLATRFAARYFLPVLVQMPIALGALALIVSIIGLHELGVSTPWLDMLALAATTTAGCAGLVVINRWYKQLRKPAGDN